MVSTRNRKPCFGGIGFITLVGWSMPNGRDCVGKKISIRLIRVNNTLNSFDSPDIIAVIVKISLLHLNSGLTMSILANCHAQKI